MSSCTFRVAALIIPLVAGSCAIPTPDKHPPASQLRNNCSSNAAADCQHLLVAGQPTFIELFAHQKCALTGVFLDSNERYQLEIVHMSNIQDGGISASYGEVTPWPGCQRSSQGQLMVSQPITELGFCNTGMTRFPMSMLRRSKKHNWFELILSSNNCASNTHIGLSELEKGAKASQYIFKPRYDGELSLFVNDSVWFYANNKGYFRFRLEKIEK